MLHTMVNTAKWAELTPNYQSLIKTACQAANCGHDGPAMTPEIRGAEKARGLRRKAGAFSPGRA